MLIDREAPSTHPTGARPVVPAAGRVDRYSRQRREVDDGRPEETLVDAGEPISYLALENGTPVTGSSGVEFGTVVHVLQIPQLDEFDGIVVGTEHGHRFVDRDQIEEITTASVRCHLTDEQVAALPAPDGPPVLHLDVAYDEGSSLNARFARLFRRPHWRELE